MARRRTGSIRQRAEGVFEVAVTVAKQLAVEEYGRWMRDFRKDDERMRDTALAVVEALPPLREWRRRRYETVYGTRADAERRLQEMQVENDDSVVPVSAWTLDELIAWWLDQVIRPEQKVTTLETYERYARLYVSKQLGFRRIDELQAYHVRMWQTSMMDAGYKERTIQGMRKVVYGALQEAVKYKWLPENVSRAELVKGPKLSLPRIKVPDVDVVQAMLVESKQQGHRFAALFHVLAHTGMRVSEALGLTWEDVDVLEGRLFVRRPLEDSKRYGLRHGAPKTDASLRTVPVDRGTVDVLMLHRAAQDAAREALGPEWSDLQLVFPNSSGGFLHRQQVTRELKHFLPNASAHTLRHFFATMIVETTGRIDQARDLLGHSSGAITMRYYLHPVEEGKRDAQAAVGRLLDAPIGGSMADEELTALFVETKE